jgi:hypothetical protein
VYEAFALGLQAGRALNAGMRGIKMIIDVKAKIIEAQSSIEV